MLSVLEQAGGSINQRGEPCRLRRHRPRPRIGKATIGRQQVGILGILCGLTVRDFTQTGLVWFRWEKFLGIRRKSLDVRNGPKSVTHHAAGTGTSTRIGMTIPSHPSSEMHLGQFVDRTEFLCWIVNFRTEVCSKVKNPTRAKDFLDCEEMELMMV